MCASQSKTDPAVLGDKLPPGVGWAAGHYPELAPWLKGLPPDAPLNWSTVRTICAPGKPVNRQAALMIIMNYLRRPGP